MRRPLKVFAFDPSHGRQLGNHMIVHVPYERDLKPGPVGERIAVIDYDATNKCYYDPVDLDRPEILLAQGLDPSESNPQFHQQMVYAVAAETTSVCEQALGRPIRWRFHWRGPRGRSTQQDLRERDHLRIFPHAMQEANAYYSREFGALLFGYFANEKDLEQGLTPRHVFSCLSHDIIAHETAHAILDVLRNQYMIASNADVAAFHEAFADLVALFQHFSVKEALLDTIQRTGGRLHRSELAPDVAPGANGPMILGEIPGANPLLQLARQFGESTGLRGALRSALGTPPRPDALAQTLESHGRGAILVAAVFDAFFTVYLKRTRDLMRIARAGGAVTGAGELHPDLADRLAEEAAKTAAHFARICVRAIDYCPVADVTFGDYLRALVTADFDAVPEDPFGYREAVIQAFVARGIRPENITSTSEEALRWPLVEQPRARRALDTTTLAKLQVDIEQLRVPGRRISAALDVLYEQRARFIHQFATQHRGLLGLARKLPISVGVIAQSLRVHEDGIPRPEYVILLHQRGRVTSKQRALELTVSGGSTVIVAGDGTLRYVIAKPATHKARIERQQAFLAQRIDSDPRCQYAGDREMAELAEQKLRVDLAALHRGY
ncbi:MAG TPA: hypothetical protein VJ011_02650 [Steroidobacteraceae bacterium]|nr:hypothetical protein [Steroidobacteraceae bacterium]